MAALNALLRQELKINFIGFSRGSVEAIHMTHELQRIQDYVNQDDAELSADKLIKCISETMNYWRLQAINDTYKEALQTVLENPQWRNNLISGLRSLNLKINGSLLDPVPGFCQGTILNTWLEWTDDDPTRIPKIVNQLQVYYMLHEFSIGFIPVWVEVTPGSKTQITRTFLPGMHSTAMGNPVNLKPYTLKTSEKPFSFEKTRSVQKIYFYELLRFAAKLKPANEMCGRYLSDVFHHFMKNQGKEAVQN